MSAKLKSQKKRKLSHIGATKKDIKKTSVGPQADGLTLNRLLGEKVEQMYAEKKSILEKGENDDEQEAEECDYSSGISDQVGIFKLKYHELSKREKLKRVKWLWKSTYAKAKGASAIIRKHYDQN